MKKIKLPLVIAMIFCTFHIITVVFTLILTKGSGEGQAFLVYFIDYPLVRVLYKFSFGFNILNNSSTFVYISFISIAGTLMYGVAGYVVGTFIKFISNKNRT